MSVDIDRALAGAEEAVASGRSLRGTGFWRAVDAVKRDRSLVDRYAERIGTIDRRAFENGVKLRVPAGIGLVALAAMTVVGVGLAWLSTRAAAPLPSQAPLTTPSLDFYRWWGFVPMAFLVGFGAVLIGTHCLAHWVAGRVVGIRFTQVFLGGPPPPRPGLKTDYATYLRASPRARAAMHASGAIVTKVVPFVFLLIAAASFAGWPWMRWLMLFVGVVQIVTDIVLSTKVSDWKKVLRELRIARSA